MGSQLNKEGVNTGIGWCDVTVNLWWGCAKVHEGCKNCYAEHLSEVRHKNGIWGENSDRKRIKSAFSNLRKFQKQAVQDGARRKVFVGSMMDIFEDSKPLSNSISGFNTTGDLRDEFFKRIREGEYENLIFLFLTKRPENISKIVPQDLLEKENLWFGTSISSPKTIPYGEVLKKQPVRNRFLSIEPQLDNIHLSQIGHILDSIHWIIQGGESGNKKRPFDVLWGYTMRNICKVWNIPFFFKQVDKVIPVPNDLMIRNFPKSMIK